MEPHIQYTQTTDGVSIAYWTLGEGAPMIHAPWHPVSHILMEWNDPDWRRWYERLINIRRLVRYDGRGTGLSQRIDDHTLDALVRDLEAVVDRLGLDQFDLLAFHHAGFIAVTYASRHPERVSHLVLWCPYARGSDWWSPDSEQFVAMLENWERFTYAKMYDRLGWSAGEAAERHARILQGSLSPEGWRAAVTALRTFDVTAVLPLLRSPTVVLHRRAVPFPSLHHSREVAARIPGARFVVVEGDSRAPYLGDMDSVLAAVAEFLGVQASLAGPHASGTVRTVLFTDIVGHTEMMSRLGDEKGREVLREHERITRDVLKAHGGTEVKTMGDGFMVSFGSATRALECAIAMQRAFGEWNEGSLRSQGGPSTSSGRTEIKVRIGLNAGEPIAEESDLFGTAVITAARIAGQAKGGEILASDVVRQLVAGKGFVFSDRGETALRGFEEPVRLYEVRWREDSR